MQETYIDLYDKFYRLQWLMKRRHLQNFAEFGPMADPTRGQGRVLAILRMQEEISTKDLSYLLGIRQQSLNELLNKLEKGGFVTRTQSETDRRVMMVKLTEKGKNAKSESVNLGGVFDCLSEDERIAFGRCLDKIIESLEAQLDDESEGEDFDWIRNAKEKFGREHMERLMAMRRGGFPFREGFEEFFGGHFGGCRRPGNSPNHAHSPFGADDPQDPEEEDRKERDDE
jgi:DNA-binding MarR family transcriptional regulator